MNAKGSVFKYPDNVDTDVIIPARHLNTQDPKELASHCMEAVSYTHLSVQRCRRTRILLAQSITAITALMVPEKLPSKI